MQVLNRYKFQLLAGLVAATVLVTAGVVAVLNQPKAVNPQPNTNTPPSPNPAPNQSTPPAVTPPKPDKLVLEKTSTAGDDSPYPGTKIKTYKFTSYELGISFKVASFSNWPLTVERVKNKVYVYGKNDVERFGLKDAREAGQSVEVFPKEAGQNLTKAIEERFLKNIDPEDCFVIGENKESGIYRQIDYPIPADQSHGPWESPDCPNGYRRTNGLRYFFTDNKEQDKYVFFNIGQYAIFGTANGSYPDDWKLWQETLRFL